MPIAVKGLSFLNMKIYLSRKLRSRPCKTPTIQTICSLCDHKLKWLRSVARHPLIGSIRLFLTAEQLKTMKGQWTRVYHRQAFVLDHEIIGELRVVSSHFRFSLKLLAHGYLPFSMSLVRYANATSLSQCTSDPPDYEIIAFEARVLDGRHSTIFNFYFP